MLPMVKTGEAQVIELDTAEHVEIRPKVPQQASRCDHVAKQPSQRK